MQAQPTETTAVVLATTLLTSKIPNAVRQQTMETTNAAKCSLLLRARLRARLRALLRAFFSLARQVPFLQYYPRKPEPEEMTLVESEGTTPEGTTPEGTTPEGTTPEGTTPEGTTPEGTTAPKLIFHFH